MKWLNAWLIAVVITYAVVRALTGSGLHLASGSVSAQVRDVLWFSLLCGLASFATIEVIKRLSDVRGRYQLRLTTAWLYARSHYAGTGSVPFEELLGAMGFTPDPMPGEVLRAFNLPAEQLSAQISGAADVALTRPDEFPDLVSCLVGRPSTTPSTRSKEPPVATDDAVTDPHVSSQTRLPNESDIFYEDAQLVRAGVDHLQIILGERWRTLIQGAAVWIAGAYGIGLTHAAQLPNNAEPREVLAALMIGGPIAWIARDLSALIERLRR